MKKRYKILICTLVIIVLLVGVSFTYLLTGNYKATEEALKYLNSTVEVNVSKIDEGYFFDGPGTNTAIVFYPGAKVEYEAYAKLMYKIAEQGSDCFLIKMPFNMAIFSINKADKIIDKFNYKSWYIAGHSMGGAMACNYASSHAEKLKGVIALAGYPTKQIPNSLELILIYGSEDKILTRNNYEDGKKYYPTKYRELVIEGGNHAFFADYGEQKKDGRASISVEEQQNQTVNFIFEEKKEQSIINEKINKLLKENETEEKIIDNKIELKAIGNEKYEFSYNSEKYIAQYTTDNWKIIDSYKINNKNDIKVICQELINIHPIHGKNMVSYRDAEDMAYEWLQHNLAYKLLPETSSWKENVKDVDLNPEDQGKSLLELYKDRTGQDFDFYDIIL